MSIPTSVLDANVLVSAVFGGVPFRAVQLAYKYQVCFSPSIEKELLTLPDKLAKKLSSENILMLRHHLRVLLAKGRQVKVTRYIHCCRDSKDNAYLETCLAAKANYLITGDKDLLDLPARTLERAGLGSLLVVSPKQFLQIVR